MDRAHALFTAPSSICVHVIPAVSRFSPPPYSPSSFRADFISANRYDSTGARVIRTDVVRDVADAHGV